MRQRVCLVLFVVSVVALGLTQRAAADEHYDHGTVHLYGGLGLGFGGKAKIDASGPFGFFATQSSDDLTTSIGGQVGVDVPVLHYLSLGGEARLLGFNTKTLDDRNVDRSKLLDLDFKPRLRLPLRQLELYFTVPVGLTVPFLANDFGDNLQSDAKVGWNLGVGGGVNWWLARGFALNAEPMFVIHKFRVDGDNGGNADITLKQFTLFLNAVLAL